MIKRNTIQRSMVLDAVKKLHNHPTADEVFDFVKKDYPNISRATVYRNLQQLSENGEIKRREIPNSPDRYDHLTTNHYHIRCTVCGKVIDVDMDYLQGIEGQVKDSCGYKITGHNIIFEGVCKDCQKNK